MSVTASDLSLRPRLLLILESGIDIDSRERFSTFHWIQLFPTTVYRLGSQRFYRLGSGFFVTLEAWSLKAWKFKRSRLRWSGFETNSLIPYRLAPLSKDPLPTTNHICFIFGQDVLVAIVYTSTTSPTLATMTTCLCLAFVFAIPRCPHTRRPPWV